MATAIAHFSSLHLLRLSKASLHVLQDKTCLSGSILRSACWTRLGSTGVNVSLASSHHFSKHRKCRAQIIEQPMSAGAMEAKKNEAELEAGAWEDGLSKGGKWLPGSESVLGSAQAEKKEWGFLDIAKLLGAIALGVVLSLQMPIAGRRGGHQALAATSVGSRFVQIPIQRAPLKIDRGDITLSERAGYLLDYFYSTEPWAKTLILLVITGLLTTIGGMAYYRVGGGSSEGDESGNFSEAFWSSWTFVADPGTHAGETTWLKRLVAVPLTIGGMLFFALLIGLVSDAVSSKVDNLEKGQSIVIEKHHTLVVGWTPKTVPLVQALSTANLDRKEKKTIVVLGEKEKQEMDSQLREDIPIASRRGTKIISRRGVATSLEDLRRCSADGASSIVVLSPSQETQNPDEVDAQVLQTCLVLAHLPNMHADIIAEFAELDNVSILQEMHKTLVKKAPVAALPDGKDKAPAEERAVPAGQVVDENGNGNGNDNGNGNERGRSRKMVPIAAGDVASRMLVYRAMEPDLAFAMDELLTFEGNEFRFKEWPELVGKTFAEAVFMFEDAIPCGLRRRQLSKHGRRIHVNPHPDTIIEKGDRLLVVSRGEDTYRPGASQMPRTVGPALPSREQYKPYTKLLLCGWKNDIYDLLSLLNNIAMPGSEVHMMSDTSKAARERELATGPRLRNLKIKQLYGDPGSRQDLVRLPLESYDRVILLSKRGAAEGDTEADVATTTSAMYIRHEQVERGNPGCTIVAELPGPNSDGLELVQKAWLDDYIVPGTVEAKVLANLAEDTNVGAVLDEVVSDYGSNLAMQRASAYVQPGDVLSFHELQRRAMAQRDLVLGYRNQAAGGEWVLNPPDKSKPMEWIGSDQLVVLTQG